MRRRILHLVCVAPLLVAAAGCSPDSPLGVLFDPPECSIIDLKKLDAVWPQPAKIALTVKNNGGATAYDVACEIKLKTGGTIVDEGVAYFGTLESGESISEEAWFTRISTHSEYGNATYHLYWYDSQGTYHD